MICKLPTSPTICFPIHLCSLNLSQGRGSASLEQCQPIIPGGWYSSCYISGPAHPWRASCAVLFPFLSQNNKSSSLTHSSIKCLLQCILCARHWARHVANKTNKVSALTQFSLMETRGKEQVITAQYGKRCDGETLEQCVSCERRGTSLR